MRPVMIAWGPEPCDHPPAPLATLPTLDDWHFASDGHSPDLLPRCSPLIFN